MLTSPTPLFPLVNRPVPAGPMKGESEGLHARVAMAADGGVRVVDSDRLFGERLRAEL